MSDALTDIARDERRAVKLQEFVYELIDHLSGKTDFANLLESAESCDSVPRGYFGGSTSIASGLKKFVEELENKDKRAWARALFNFAKPGTSTYKKLKKMSPLDGKLLAIVDYGCGFAHIEGDMQQFFDNAIGETANMMTYDADDYLIIMDPPQIEAENVLWLRSGICGQKGPRKNESSN